MVRTMNINAGLLQWVLIVRGLGLESSYRRSRKETIAKKHGSVAVAGWGSQYETLLREVTIGKVPILARLA